jgi:hypothetical protein
VPQTPPFDPLSLVSGATLPREFSRFALGRTESGLWIAGSRTGFARAESSLLQFIGTTVGYRAFAGVVPTMEDVVSRLRQYSLEVVVLMVSRITVALNAARLMGGHETQDLLIRNHLGDAAPAVFWEGAREWVAAYGDTIDESRTVFFHERQLLNLAKVAFLILDPDHQPGAAGPLPFIEALLMMNDLMEAEIEQQDFKSAEGRQALELYQFANAYFGQGGHGVHDLVRGYHLYLSEHQEMSRQQRNLVSIPDLIEKATDLDPDTVWNILFVLFGVAFATGLEDIEKSRFSLPLDYFSSMSGVTEEEARHWTRLAARPSDEMQARVRSLYTVEDPRYFDVVAFEERPMVWFGNTVYPLSVQLLRRLAGPSLGYRIIGSTRVSDSEKRGFFTARGRAFELYVTDILRRCFDNRLLTERELLPLAKGREVCEGIVDYGDAVVLVECKAKTPALPARIGQSYAEYRSSFTPIVTKAVDQIDSTITLIQEGQFGSLGLDPGRIKKFYPVVVVQELPITIAMYQSLTEGDLAQHPLLNRRDTVRLQLFDIGDLELLEMLLESGQNAREILDDRSQSLEFSSLPLKNYCIVRGWQTRGEHSDWHGREYWRLTEQAQTFFRERGLKSDDDGPATVRA